MAVCGLLWTQPVRADIPMPAQTAFYFTLDGKPYDRPLDFVIRCYGYKTGIPPATKEPGTYGPETVYTYAGSCDHYGCTMREDLYFSYIHIDTCHLDITAEGKQFTVASYAESRPFGPCDEEPSGEEGEAGSHLPLVYCAVHVDLPSSVGLTASTAAEVVQPYVRSSSATMFLLALAVALAVEVPVLLLLVRYVFRIRNVSYGRVVVAGVLASPDDTTIVVCLPGHHSDQVLPPRR